MITIFIVQALFGLVSPLNKHALLYCSPIFFVAGKLLCAGLVLLGYHFWRHSSWHAIPLRHWPLYAQIILIGNFSAHFLKYWGLQYVSATKMAFIFNMSPFFVALFSYVRFGTKLSRIQLSGLTISFLGLIPILMTSSIQEFNMGEFLIISWPELAIFIATIMHALSMTSKRVLMHENNYWPVQVNALCFLGSGIVACLFIALNYPLYNPSSSDLPTITSYILITTFISKVVCSTLYMHLMKYYSTTLLAFMDYWYLLFVAFWSWLFFGEQVTLHFWLSAFIIFFGQYLFYREELQITKFH